MSPASIRVTSKGAQRSSLLGGSGLIAVVAFLVPALVFAVVVAAVAAWEGGQTARRSAMQQARNVIERVDAELEHDIRALAAVAKRISGAPITQTHPTPQSAALNAELFPEWIGNVVWPLGGDRAVFSSLPGEELPSIPAAWADRIGARTGPVVDGVERIGGRPVILVHLRVPGDARNLILTTALRSERFLAILKEHAPRDSVSAIVDRQGKFIARSLDQEKRFGTPATAYVRNAIGQGDTGVYRGRTYEGFKNVTAYYTSPLTGWSAHIAISDRLMESSAPLAMMVAVGGGVLSIALVGGLAWLILQDARRRQNAERAIAQAQRIESMGRLTGGIAHDFNNLLTVIIGNLERARMQGAAGAGNQAIEEALASARRAASLTRSLLLYSRQQPLSAQVVDLNAVVREAADVIRRALGEPYRVDLNLDEQAGAVRLDSAQLASALLNLAVNARDAMPDGGAVTLRTARRTLTKDDSPLGLRAGDYVQVSVSDTGAGMAPDIARRAFEPFFTTKDIGKGTGLGLAQVDGFARLSGGAAELETAPGQGTTISLTFPRAGDRPAEADVSSPPVGPWKSLGVLLVEDEPGVRDHAQGLLASLGHQVTACADAECALKAMDRSRFDLLFTDIVLPGGTSGAALAELAVQRQPGIAVLLATGYAGHELEGREGTWPVLLKPYGLADLSSGIAAAVSAAPSMPGGKVLFVEDEPLIMMMAADVLGSAGYEVVEAGSAAQARKAFAADPGAFALAVLDIGLPDGSGLDLAAALRDQREDLRIIIASGHAAASFPCSIERLPKPYTPDDLLRMVAQAPSAAASLGR